VELLQALEVALELGQLLVALGDGLLELLLLDLELQRGELVVLLEALVVLALLLELAVLPRDLLFLVGELLAQAIDVLLLGGDDLDDLFLTDELLEEQIFDLAAVLALLLDERVLRIAQATGDVVDLHLQALDLDVLLLDPVLDGEQLALAHRPDLRKARDLRFAGLELVAEDLDLRLGRAEHVAAGRAAAKLTGLGEQLGLAIGDGLEGAIEERPIFVSELAAALAAGQLRRASSGRLERWRRGRDLHGRRASAHQRVVEGGVLFFTGRRGASGGGRGDGGGEASELAHLERNGEVPMRRVRRRSVLLQRFDA
jgi:hypothetical protein